VRRWNKVSRVSRVTYRVDPTLTVSRIKVKVRVTRWILRYTCDTLNVWQKMMPSMVHRTWARPPRFPRIYFFFSSFWNCTQSDSDFVR